MLARRLRQQRNFLYNTVPNNTLNNTLSGFLRKKKQQQTRESKSSTYTRTFCFMYSRLSSKFITFYVAAANNAGLQRNDTAISLSSLPLDQFISSIVLYRDNFCLELSLFSPPHSPPSFYVFSSHPDTHVLLFLSSCSNTSRLCWRY